MKFQVKSKEFLQVLNRITPFVDKKANISILKHICIQTGDECVKIIATNLGQAVQLICPAQIENHEGEMLIDFRLVKDIIKKLKETYVTIQLDKDKIIISQGNFKIETINEDAADFPLMEIPERFNECIDLEKLEIIFTRTLFAASTDSNRPIFSGIYIEQEKSVLKAMATDGHVLALFKFDAGDNNTNFNFTIPREAVTKINKLLGFGAKRTKSGGMFGKNTFINFNLGESKIVFEIGEQEFVWTIPIEGKYPNMEKVIPLNQDVLMKIDRKRMVELLERISNFVDAVDHGIVLSLNEKTVKISSDSNEAEKASEEMDVISCTGSIRLGLNSHYLLDILHNLPYETVEFRFSNPTDAIVISSSHDSKFLFLVMPLRIRD